MTVSASAKSEAPLLAFNVISKSFGSVQALQAITLTIRRGERIAVLGHNGAGKSTLMNIITGTLSATSGHIAYRGTDHGSGWSVLTARRLGIRFAHQEFTLADNLAVFENLRLQDRSLRGRGWKRRARQLIRAALDEIFPANSISENAIIANLSVSERQMVEVARAFTGSNDDISLVVLDEPTSSLDNTTADALLNYMRKAAARGITTIFISHKLREIPAASDRVVVMKDGAVVADHLVEGLGRDNLIKLMDGGATQSVTDVADRAGQKGAGPPLMTIRADDGFTAISIGPGEVIGFGGLDGHGQREMLRRIYGRSAHGRDFGARSQDIGFVSGDRTREGIFASWSIAKNLSVRSLAKVAKFGFISRNAEARLVGTWLARLSVRLVRQTSTLPPLSGGNQQKILIARALSSDASLILLDDPTRGVDQKTKAEFYRILSAETAAGRAFIWYATEFEELRLCDRVYVFYMDRITDEIDCLDLSEARVLRSSFADVEANS